MKVAWKYENPGIRQTLICDHLMPLCWNNQLLYYELVPYIGSYSIMSKNVPMRDKTLKLVDFDENGFIA